MKSAMIEPFDLPALSTFLRRTAPRTVVHNGLPTAQQGAPQCLDATQWLERLAAVLGCSPAWLLETGRVDAHDLEERPHIGRAARLIRSYGWETPPAPAPAVATAQPSSTDTHPRAWVPAHNAYLNHLMRCQQCVAWRPREPSHCPAGAALRQRYEQAPCTGGA